MKKLQQKIAIQGFEGSFHEDLAQRRFDNPIILGKDSFQGVFESVESGESDFGLIAVENENAGIILDNYSLLSRYAKKGVRIVGESKLKIKHI